MTGVQTCALPIYKKQEAIERLGADSFLVSRDQEQVQVYMSNLFITCMGDVILRNTCLIIKKLFVVLVWIEKAAIGTMDGIIDTVSAVHPLLPLIGLLKPHGKLVMVGAPEKPLELPVFPLLMGELIYI